MESVDPLVDVLTIKLKRPKKKKNAKTSTSDGDGDGAAVVDGWGFSAAVTEAGYHIVSGVRPESIADKSGLKVQQA